MGPRSNVRRLILIGALLCAAQAEAATARYWCRDASTCSTATWNCSDGGGAVTNWSTASGLDPCDNAQPPTSIDDVFFDGVTNGNAASTLSSGITINSLDMNGYTGTLTHDSGVQLTISGSGTVFRLAGTYTKGSNTTSSLLFTGTSGTNLLTFNSLTVANITFNGIGGTWQFQDAMAENSQTSGGGITLTAGTLDTNGKAVDCGFFTGTGTTARTLTLGASAVTLRNALQTQWDITDGTNFTLTANTSTIALAPAGSVIFAGGGLATYNTVTITESGASLVRVGGANTFATLTVNGGANTAAKLSLFANQTVSGTLTLAGSSVINRLYVTSDTLGTARTLSAGTATISNADFEDITGAGASGWDLSAASVGNCGGNSGITFPTPVNRFWVGGTGNWSSTGEWSATSGGASGAAVPLVHDTAVFDQNSFSAGSQEVTQNMVRISGVNWAGGTGVTNTPTWTTSTLASVYGSIILASGMNLTGSTLAYTLAGRGAYSLTSAGKTWAKNFTVSAIGGTYTITDNFATGASKSLILTFGTLTTTSANVTGGSFASDNINTRALTMGSGTWSFGSSGTVWDITTTTGLTLNAGTSTIKLTDATATDKTFDGGGLTYNNYYATGAGTGDFNFVGSNTFADFKVDTPPQEIGFTAGTTTTVSTFTVNGTAGNLMTIGSLTASGHTLTKAGGGTICSDYLSISRSTASPATTWYAGANSTNGGNNSGWTFTGCAGGRGRRRSSASLWPFTDTDAAIERLERLALR